MAWCRRVTVTILLLSAGYGHSDYPGVRIVSLDPASGGGLYVGERLSVRLAYDSGEPLRFRIEAYQSGRRIDGVYSNPMPLYPAGAGEAIVWLALQRVGAVDEVRIRILDDTWRPRGALAHPVALRWTSTPSANARLPAGWVTALNAAQQSMVRAGAQKAPSEEAFAGESLLVLLMGWSIPAYLVLQIYALRRFREVWRTAALVPLYVMVPLTAYTAFAMISGSNLWPLMLLFFAPLAFLYLAVVSLLRVRSALAPQ